MDPCSIRQSLSRAAIGLVAALVVEACSAGAITPTATAPSSPAPPASVPVLPPGKQPHAMPSLVPAMVAAEVGMAAVARSGAIWAIRGHAFAVSTDLGTSWTVGTVPLPAPDSISPSIFVLDATHAWSITASPGSADRGQGPFDRVDLIVNWTSDGGRSWAHAPVPGDYPDTARTLFFLDPQHGFLMVSGGRSNAGASTLLRTSDGGATWSVARTVPAAETSGGPLGSLITATNGRTIWAAGQPEAGPVAHPLFEVTHDDGVSWSPVALPGVSAASGSPGLLGPAVFLDAAAGFFALPTSDPASGSGTLVFSTADGGRTWTRRSTLSGALAAPIAYADARHWLAVEQGLPTFLEVTDDGGATWRTLHPTGLSLGSLAWASLLDAQHGTGVLLVDGDSGMPQILVVTSDGGSSWTPVGRLPAPVAGATSAPTPAPSRPASPAPSPAWSLALAAPCRAADLRARAELGAGGTGTVGADVAFTDVGDAPCTLSGSPASIELLGADGSALPLVIGTPEETPGPPVTLSPGVADSAGLGINWQNWCGALVGSLRVRVALPGGGTVTTTPAGPLGGDVVPRCDHPEAPSELILVFSFISPTR